MAHDGNRVTHAAARARKQNLRGTWTLEFGVGLMVAYCTCIYGSHYTSGRGPSDCTRKASAVTRGRNPGKRRGRVTSSSARGMAAAAHRLAGHDEHHQRQVDWQFTTADARIKLRLSDMSTRERDLSILVDHGLRVPGRVSHCIE